MTTTNAKIKIDVWVDIMCPVCYIGKRSFEHALERFDDNGQTEVEWHSFQIDPSLPQDAVMGETIYRYLIRSRNITYQQAKGIVETDTQHAANAGLTFNLSSAVPVNSFRAHRIIQKAKIKGLGNKAVERFLAAWHVEGSNLGDPDILVELSKTFGLNSSDAMVALTNDYYAYRVKHDIDEAVKFGAKTMPFFLFNRRQLLSGAHSPRSYLEMLEGLKKN